MFTFQRSNLEYMNYVSIGLLLFFNGLKTEAHLPCVFCLTQALWNLERGAPPPPPASPIIYFLLMESPHNRYPIATATSVRPRAGAQPLAAQLEGTPVAAIAALPLEGSERGS